MIAAPFIFYLAISTALAIPAAHQDGVPFSVFNSTVRVKRPYDGNRFVIGTGICIDEADDHYLILSNHHVTLNNRQLKIDVFRNGFLTDPSEQAKAYWSILKDGMDVSLTKLPKDQVPEGLAVTPLAPKGYEPAVGQKILTHGCSSGRWPRCRVGHIDKIENGRIWYSPPSIGGDSGSAGFDETGTQVIGLTAWSNGTHGLAMLSDRVHDVIENAEAPGQNYDPAEPFRFWRRGFEEITPAWPASVQWFQSDNIAPGMLNQLNDLDDLIETTAERRTWREQIRHDCDEIQKNQRSMFPIIDQIKFFLRVCIWGCIGLAVLVVIGHPATSWIFAMLFGWATRGLKNLKNFFSNAKTTE